jgi:hypothetical protein
MGRGRGIWAIEIDLAPYWRLFRDHPAEVVVWLGAFLRVLVYLQDRTYWMDEGSLLGNIVDVGVFDFSHHLAGDQLAPFLFLVIQRVIAIVFGDSGYAMRFVPLLGGLASLWLFKALVTRRLSRPSALVALVLFSFSDDLIYYSSELKQYATDLAFGLVVVLVSSGLLARRSETRDLAMLLTLVILAPWISFTSAFVISGCGAVLVGDRLTRSEWLEAMKLVVVAACWLASFGLAYVASQSVISPATTLYVFWNFAFFPVPPAGPADVRHAAGLLLECFVNPMNLIPASMPLWIVAFPLGILVVGACSMARRNGPLFLMLSLPIVLAMIAAAMRRYPFHGRLILGLLPFVFIMLAEGADWFRLRLGRWAFGIILALLLTYPCLNTLYQVSGTRPRYFNRYGDLHDNRFIESWNSEGRDRDPLSPLHG